VCPTKNVSIELGALRKEFKPSSCRKFSNDSWLNKIHYSEITDSADVLQKLYCVAVDEAAVPKATVPEGTALETIEQCIDLRIDNTNAAPVPNNICVLTTTQC